MEEKKINVYIESNPNPNSLKFVTNFMLIPEGENYDFIDSNELHHIMKVGLVSV